MTDISQALTKIEAQLTAATQMKRFEVYRPSPPTEYYEKGHANVPDEVQYEGVVFTDGTAVIRWRTPFRSHSVWASFDDLMAVHGHPEYGTVVKWLDAPTYLAALVEVAKAATELHHVLGAEANWRDGHPDKCPDSPTETCISCIYEAGNALEASLDALTKAVDE